MFKTLTRRSVLLAGALVAGLSLSAVALVHTALAFAILSFFIVHVYMTTTGHSILAHTKAMITGWEEVAEGEYVEEWEKKTV